MKVGKLFARLRRKAEKATVPSRQEPVRDLDRFQAEAKKADLTAHLFSRLTTTDQRLNGSRLAPALTSGTKPHSVAYETTVQGRAFSWPVAQLEGGDHGPYCVAKVLRGAKGAYGKVRIGVDGEGRQVAVKVLRLVGKRGAPTQKSLEEDVLHEVRAMAAMGPGYEALDVICVGEKVYIVMPLAGGDLKDVLAPRGAGSPARDVTAMQRAQLANSVLAQISAPLAHLHANGWMHGDLKLSNLLWSSEGLLRVADFGLAARVPCADLRGSLCSIAPEVLAGRGEYDGRADVWSLGATLCEIMTQKSKIFTQYDAADGPRDRDGDFTDFGLTLRNHQDFAVWRSRIQRLGDGSFDLKSIDPHRESDPLRKWFSQCFATMREVDAKLCQFILRDMLAVDPRDRATMAEVRDHAASLMEPGSQAAVAKLLRQCVPQDLSREGVLTLLHQVAGKQPGA